jgi:hypothetical protein
MALRGQWDVWKFWIRSAAMEMTKVVVKRGSIEHHAIQALCLFDQRGNNMQGIKGVSKLPRWVRNSWNGYQFEEFSIYLTPAAQAQVKAYCEKYARY